MKLPKSAFKDILCSFRRTHSQHSRHTDSTTYSSSTLATSWSILLECFHKVVRSTLTSKLSELELFKNSKNMPVRFAVLENGDLLKLSGWPWEMAKIHVVENDRNAVSMDESSPMQHWTRQRSQWLMLVDTALRSFSTTWTGPFPMVSRKAATRPRF